jgi:hypothetical protein
MPYPSETVIAQARSGDTAAFLELAGHHEPVLRELAESRPGLANADAIILGALVEAFRAMPTFTGGPAEVERWLTGFVENATARADVAEGELWPRLAAELGSHAPALAAPEMPERRFPVVPSLGSRGRRSRR